MGKKICPVCDGEILTDAKRFCSYDCMHQWTKKDMEIRHGKPLRQLVVESLNANPSIEEAGKSLGISCRTMRNWMEQLGVVRVTFFE